jgi:glycosyltransferase involved in cell wall biosynthesis
MGDANAYYHLKPLATALPVRALWVLRPNGPVKRAPIPNTHFRPIPGRTILSKLLAIYRAAVDLGRRKDVIAFASFFAVPYGVIALLAGIRTGKPVHIGFVGSDWTRIGAGPFGKLLDKVLRRADLITVTGSSVKAEMIARGYSEARIVCLRHAVDVDSYDLVPTPDRAYDVLFVGLLLPVKRVDLVMDAVSAVQKSLANVRACIVGDGPLYRDLLDLRDRLGLARNVDFVGYQDDPSPYFSKARIIVIASEREGFPFALVEGICAGAVPVATGVGAIPEFVTHDVNGIIVPPGDPAAIADAVSALLEDPIRYDRLKRGAMELRAQFRMERVTADWENWLGRMCGGSLESS